MNESDIQLIVSLLEQTTTIPIVQKFLKDNGLPHSGTWEDIYKKRVLPAVLDNKLTNRDLLSFLSEVEEYGNQHIFLYQCDEGLVDELMNKAATEKKLIDIGYSDALYNSNALSQPNDPEVSEIRWEEDGEDKRLIFKIKETRVFEVHDKDVRENGVLTRLYNLVRKRVVTVATLHSNGCLEIRIPSQTGSYLSEITRIFKLLKIIPKASCSAISLTKAKKEIWENRVTLSHSIRFSNSYLRNEHGIKITASTGSKKDDLALDAGAVSGLQGFLNHNGDYEGINFWFKESTPLPSEDIHVILNGELNEFAIPANCSKSDYKYVLNEIKKLNI